MKKETTTYICDLCEVKIIDPISRLTPYCVTLIIGRNENRFDVCQECLKTDFSINNYPKDTKNLFKKLWDKFIARKLKVIE